MSTRPAHDLPACLAMLLVLTGCAEADSSEEIPGANQTAQTLSGGEGEGSGVGVVMRLNHNPVVTNMTVESPAPTLQSLSVQAHDRDGDPVSFLWSANCAGRFDDAQAIQPSFTPEWPLPPSCTFHVEVSDDLGGMGFGDLTVSLRLPDIQVGSE